MLLGVLLNLRQKVLDINELENLRIKELNKVDEQKGQAFAHGLLVSFIGLIVILLAYYFLNPKAANTFLTISFYFIFIDIDRSYILRLNLPFVLKFTIAMSLLCIMVYLCDSAIKTPNFIGIMAITACLIFSIFTIYKETLRRAKNRAKIKYVEIFKTKYLKDYFANLGFTYEPEGSIMSMYIKNSKFFKMADTIIFQSDKIMGKVDDVYFELSDMAMWQEKKEQYLGGIFLHALFNKTANSNLFVISNDARNTTNDNAKKLSKITMDDTQFNRIFRVYSNDMQNAMYILSPALMKRLLDLKRQLKVPISISFTNDKIYFFLDIGKDNLEPSIDKSVLHANPAFTIKRELSHFLSIVKTLNLNTKIWKI